MFVTDRDKYLKERASNILALYPYHKLSSLEYLPGGPDTEAICDLCGTYSGGKPILALKLETLLSHRYIFLCVNSNGCIARLFKQAVKT